MKSKLLVIGIALALSLFLVSGCVGGAPEVEAPGTGGETGETPEETDQAGTNTYTGTWSGNWLGSQVGGNFELTVNSDEGTATGSFSGDAVGSLDGSISEGELEASGTAQGYQVTWTGTISGDSISGTWSSKQDIGSGEWSGTLSETEEETTENETETEEETEETEEALISSGGSISFSVDAEGPDFNGTRTLEYKARNIGTNETEINLETSEGVFILSEKENGGWMKVEGQWYSFSAFPSMSFEDNWDTHSTSLKNYVDYMSGWESGELTTEGPDGNTFTFYNIEVNPTFEDNTFHPENVAETPSY